MYLLDTVVVSALRRQDRFPRVVASVRKQRTADLFLSVVSAGGTVTLMTSRSSIITEEQANG